MTDNMAPVSSKTAGDILALLGELRSVPAYRTRADSLCAQLGESLAIAGEHRSHFEMMCMELLEAVGRATGRPVSTLATVANVKAATEALEHTAPVLGNVIALPRAANRGPDVMLPPIAAILVVDGRRADPVDVWALPSVGHMMQVERPRIPGEKLPRAKRVPVLDVVWLGFGVAEVHLGQVFGEQEQEIAQVGP